MVPPLPCSEEAVLCPWFVLLLEGCPGARLREQMLSNLFYSLCSSSPGPGEARPALGGGLIELMCLGIGRSCIIPEQPEVLNMPLGIAEGFSVLVQCC